MTPGPAILIQTPRLTLREMDAADAGDLQRIVTLPDVGRMLFLFPPDWTVADAAAFIPKVRFGNTANGRLAICDNAGRFVGSVGLAERNNATEIFYFLDPATAGQGYGTEAVGAFLDWAFARYGPRDITAYVFQDNLASARLLEKLGFRYIGRCDGHISGTA